MLSHNIPEMVIQGSGKVKAAEELPGELQAIKRKKKRVKSTKPSAKGRGTYG